MAEPDAPMSWSKIILILVATSLVLGLTIGGLREGLGLSGGAATAGVGAGVGVVAAILIGRRRAQRP